MYGLYDHINAVKMNCYNRYQAKWREASMNLLWPLVPFYEGGEEGSSHVSLYLW